MDDPPGPSWEEEDDGWNDPEADDEDEEYNEEEGEE